MEEKEGKVLIYRLPLIDYYHNNLLDHSMRKTMMIDCWRDTLTKAIIDQALGLIDYEPQNFNFKQPLIDQTYKVINYLVYCPPSFFFWTLACIWSSLFPTGTLTSLVLHPLAKYFNFLHYNISKGTFTSNRKYVSDKIVFIRHEKDHLLENFLRVFLFNFNQLCYL